MVLILCLFLEFGCIDEVFEDLIFGDLDWVYCCCRLYISEVWR